MIAALILAGGRATRMGGADKALLELAPGNALLDELLARLRPQAAAIAISANGDPARFARFGLPVLADVVMDQGPLAGLLQGLRWASLLGASVLLTVPGDSPFIPTSLAQLLHPAPSFAVAGGASHPLTALWPVMAAASLERHLAGAASRSVARFASTLGARPVPLDSEHLLLNINTQADLALARETVTRPSWTRPDAL